MRGWYIRLIRCAGSNTKQMDCTLFLWWLLHNVVHSTYSNTSQ